MSLLLGLKFWLGKSVNVWKMKPNQTKQKKTYKQQSQVFGF